VSRRESARRRRRGSVQKTCSEAILSSTSSRTAASRSRGGQEGPSISGHDRLCHFLLMLSPLRWDDDVVFKNCAKGEPKNKVDIYQLVNKVQNFVKLCRKLEYPNGL